MDDHESRWLAIPRWKLISIKLTRAIYHHWCGRIAEFPHQWYFLSSFLCDKVQYPIILYYYIYIHIYFYMKPPKKRNIGIFSASLHHVFCSEIVWWWSRLDSRLGWCIPVVYLLCKWCSAGIITLPETNSSPLKMVVSNRNLLFQGSIFRGELLVSGRVFYQKSNFMEFHRNTMNRDYNDMKVHRLAQLLNATGTGCASDDAACSLSMSWGNLGKIKEAWDCLTDG